MTGHVDPLRVSLQVGLYIFFYVFFLSLLGLSGLVTLLGMFAGSALAGPPPAPTVTVNPTTYTMRASTSATVTP